MDPLGRRKRRRNTSKLDSLASEQSLDRSSSDSEAGDDSDSDMNMPTRRERRSRGELTPARHAELKWRRHPSTVLLEIPPSRELQSTIKSTLWMMGLTKITSSLPISLSTWVSISNSRTVRI